LGARGPEPEQGPQLVWRGGNIDEVVVFLHAVTLPSDLAIQTVTPSADPVPSRASKFGA
jgi:hypothetical protein